MLRPPSVPTKPFVRHLGPAPERSPTLRTLRTLRSPDAARRWLAPALLDWYGRHRRDLPWRRQRDPYAILVSEMMLQQTQVKTVLDYYERWMRRFPTLGALAVADEADVLHAWQGLGYYSRARNLLRAAREVVAKHGGELPRDARALRELPGIGPYSAGAIASIAFGLAEPIVDGNVIRVLTRVFALRGDPARAPLKAELWRLARDLIPEDRASDFNQGLMELGATVCLPRAPRCDACPLRKRCAARQAGLEDELPETAPRAKPTPVRMAGALVTRKGRVLLVQLPSGAPRWAGMWQFPNAEVGPSEAPQATALRAASAVADVTLEAGEIACVVQHSVTRYRITLEIYRCDVKGGSAAPRSGVTATWVKPGELESFALPSAHRRIARHVYPP